ncbi:MAG: hypothetical protein JETCAE03_36100 [Ignavibacteriaceae bacterium]|jgi:hypothetical protein|nr:MAG: hypothetical protein JETCAE03_36100 [Ignavibacteriaceae bacterium]
MEKILTSEQIRESWDLASQADIVFKIRKARFFKIKRFLSKFLRFFHMTMYICEIDITPKNRNGRPICMK